MEQPRSWEEVSSIPLWFNKCLKTKFDPEMSRNHFNFVGELFSNNKVVTRGALEQRRINNDVIIKVLAIIEKIPANYIGMAAKYPIENLIVRPDPYLYLNGVVHWTKISKSKLLYKKIIETKVSLPKGLLNWCIEFELHDEHINLALSFAKRCTANTKTQVFQYKINTNTLATNEYLFRYRVLDNDRCVKCQDEEQDTIVHCLWDCPSIQQFLSQILRNIVNWTGIEVGMTEYLFGNPGKDNTGVNHYLLQAKMFLFYEWSMEGHRDEPVHDKITRFHCKVRKTIIVEKDFAIKNSKWETFLEKWQNFEDIYVLLGPDNFQIF